MSSIQGIKVGNVDDVFVFHVLRCVGGRQAEGHDSRFKLTWSSCGSAQTLNRSKEIRLDGVLFRYPSESQKHSTTSGNVFDSRLDI